MNISTKILHNNLIKIKRCQNYSTAPLRRALLYMPGNDERKMTKALNLEVDCICLDLEDAVSKN
jgi:hypothetical protein